MKTYRLLSALALFKFAATTAVAGGWGHDDSSSSSDDEPCVKKCKWASKRDAYPELNWWERKFYKEIDLRKNLKCSTDGPGPQGEPECRDYCWGVRCEDPKKPQFSKKCPANEQCCPDGYFCWDPILDVDLQGPEACGDPHMTGFLGQKFDFTGKDGGWYALVADSGLDINMRVTTPIADLPEITYITGLSVITIDEDDVDHSIVIEVKDPHSLDSACPAGVSPCLADGALRVVIDGQETLAAPGSVFVGQGVEIMAANLPGACRSFGFEKYWERKKAEYAAHGRRLEGKLDMAEWILADPTITNMAECEEYVAHAEATEGVFAHQSEHVSFQIMTPKGNIRLSHGRLHQVAMRDPTDQYDLPDHLTWQMNMAITHNQVTHSAQGILGQTYVPTRDDEGEAIMNGIEAIRGTQEDYRVEGPLSTAFIQDAHAN